MKVKRGNMKVKGGKEERVQLLPPNPPATDQNKNKTHLQKREDKERHSLAGKILQRLWKQLTTVGVFLINHVPTGVEWGGPSDGKVPGPGCQWFAVTQICSWHWVDKDGLHDNESSKERLRKYIWEPTYWLLLRPVLQDATPASSCGLTLSTKDWQAGKEHAKALKRSSDPGKGSGWHVGNFLSKPFLGILFSRI